MTVDIRPDPLAPLRSALEPAPWGLAIEGTIQGEPVTVPFVAVVPPELKHYCPDGICADYAAVYAAIHRAADNRSLEAWARGVQLENKRRKRDRGKRVKALRRQLVGAQP